MVEGVNMQIRDINKEDAQQVVDLMIKLDKESDFLLYEPGEREKNYQKQVKGLETFAGQEDRTILIATEQNEIVGYILLVQGTCQRNLHTAYLAMGVLNEYQGRGIGTELLHKAKEWAQERGVSRLELTVMQHNLNAIKLYTKAGFVCEGVKKKSLRISDKWIDELYMACFLCD